MGPVIDAIVFFGKLLVGTAGTAFQQFLARAAFTIGLSVVSSKLFGPRLPDARSTLQSKSITVRSTLEYHKVVYGRAMVSGPINYHNLQGNNGQFAWYVIPVCLGQSAGIDEIWFDGTQFLAANIDWTAGTGGADGTGTGELDDAAYKNTDTSPDTFAVNIRWALGHPDQVDMSALTGTFGDLNSTFRGRGITYIAVRMLYDEDTESIWEENGQPNDMKALVKGRLLYDPRLDSTAVIDSTTSPVTMGSGSHRSSDSTTWAWSDNPALCWLDYYTQVMGVAFTKMDLESVAAAADDCDTLVDIPPVASPQTQETRFTCNGALSLGDTHRENLQAILSSMAGRQTWKQGKWSVYASVWQTPTLTFDGDDLTEDPILVVGGRSRAERWNTVRGYYVDPDRKYEAVEFQQVTAAAYVTRDAGKTLPFDLELPMTNSEYMAQRIAYRLLEQGNNQISARTRLNARGALLGAGDVATYDWPPFEWTASENLILQSENLATSWSVSGVTVSSDAKPSPFGTSADKLVEDGTTGLHRPLQTISGYDVTEDVTVSVYVKAAERKYFYLFAFNAAATTNYFGARFDLVAGTRDSQSKAGGGQFIKGGVEYAGNGWYRCWMNGIADTAGGATDGWQIQLRLLDNSKVQTYTGDGTSGLYAFGFQVERTADGEPTAYKKTTTAAVTTTTKTLRVTEWERAEDGTYPVTLIEDDAADYTDPLVAEYTVVTGGAITVPAFVVAPPTNLAAASIVGGVQLSWSDPASRLYKFIEIYASETNSYASASLIGIAPRSPFVHYLPLTFKTQYYWIRAVNVFGDVSDIEPLNSPDTGVSGIPGLDARQSLTDDPDFALTTGFSGSFSTYWEIVAKNGTGFTIASTFTFNLTGGANSTPSINLQPGNGTAASVYLIARKRVRLNSGAINCRVRYKTTGSTAAQFEFRAYAYASQTTPTSAGSTFRETTVPGTSGAWKIIDLVIDVSAIDTGQFWAFSIAAMSAVHIEVDSFFVYPTTLFGKSPVNVQNGNYTFRESDVGKTVRYDSNVSPAPTYTIPAFDSADFEVGDMIAIDNDGGGNLFIAITTDELMNSADGATGTRTLADGGQAVIRLVTDQTTASPPTARWKITGDQLT